jgi:hypothetical protein
MTPYAFVGSYDRCSRAACLLYYTGEAATAARMSGISYEMSCGQRCSARPTRRPRRRWRPTVRTWLPDGAGRTDGQSVGRDAGLTSGTFYGNLQRYFWDAGLRPAGVHIFRHTAAKLRRDAGESIEDVSRFLDYSSLAATTDRRRLAGGSGLGEGGEGARYFVTSQRALASNTVLCTMNSVSGRALTCGGRQPHLSRSSAPLTGSRFASTCVTDSPITPPTQRP